MSLDNDSPEMLERREILRRAAWILGGAISAPAALAILQGCSAKHDAPAVATPALKFLKPDQYLVIAEIAEIMLPKTDTSGAKDVGVPAFIDVALDAVYDPESKDRFNAGFADFEAAAKAGGKPFLEQEPAVRAAFVKRSLEIELAGERTPKPFILMTRELALLGYFTSQPGITQNMTYEAVPTVYHGCVPVSQMKMPVYWE
jgi:gluconate 2-dehydrogenase gamma chain